MHVFAAGRLPSLRAEIQKKSHEATEFHRCNGGALVKVAQGYFEMTVACVGLELLDVLQSRLTQM